MDLNDMYEDDRSEGYNYFVMEEIFIFDDDYY